MRAMLGVTAALGVAAAMTMSVAPASLASTAKTGSTSAAFAAKPPYSIVLSNNFLGNDWRPQVEKLAKLTANVPPFKGVVNLRIVNSADTNQAQLGDLNSIIETKPNAILLIPGSTTALDPAIQRACAAGILVFTLSAPVEAPCAINLNQNFYAGNQAMGQWMAKAMKGTGSVFIDQGVPGLGISETIENGFLQGLHQYGPKITVAGKYTGEYAPGPEQQGISSLLVAHPNVGGIMTQGYCTPAFNALKAAGKAAVPTVCYGYNGEMEACATAGHQCAILTNSTGQVQTAMLLALNILEGKQKAPHGGYAQKYWVSYPMYLYVTASPMVHLVTSMAVTSVQVLKKNVNFFPGLPSGLSLPYTLPQYAKYITPQQAAG